MDIGTATLLVNAITALLAALPSLIKAIQEMDAPDEEKEKLIQRIRNAQAALPVWE